MKSTQLSPAEGRGKWPRQRFITKALATLGLLLIGSVAMAQTISADFLGTNPTHTPMDPTETAGAVPATNWNNLTPANSSAVALKDSTGATTAVTASWSSNGLWSNSLADTPGNNRMMKGYLDSGNATTSTLTFAGLNAATTYGIYIYVVPFDPNVSASYSIGSQKYYLTDGATAPNFNGTFVQATSTNVNSPTMANYVLFAVTGQTSYTLNATPIQPNGFRAPINAFQVTVLPLPGAPTNLTAIGANNLVVVNFTGGGGATSYNLYRSTTQGAELAANATPFATGVSSGYQDTTAVNGTKYYYAVRGVNPVGVSAVSNEGSATPVAAVTGNGTGIAGLYYTGGATDFSAESGTPFFSDVLPVINFNMGNTTGYGATGFPAEILAANGSNNMFTAVWTALVQAPYTGPYQFQTITDDGARFSIDTGSGLTVQFTDNGIHGPVANTGATVNLVAGQKYPIKFEYYQGTGGATAQLLYNPLGTGFQIIPQSQLYPIFSSAPGAITNLTALGGTNSVTLSFTAPTFGSTYSIYRGTTAGGESPTPIATNVTTTSYTDTGLTNGVTYFYYVIASNNVGSGPQSNEASAAPTVPIIGNGDGLYGTYYGGADTGYNAETGAPISFGIVPTINFNAGNTGVANNPNPFPSNLPATNFTAVWTGQFLAPYTASYTFQINSDDGSRLSLGTDSTNATLALIVDNTLFQGPTVKSSAAINLVAGQKYSIKMEYFQGGGGATAQLLYSIAGSPSTIIPQTQLFSNLTTPPAQVTDLSAVAYSNSTHLYWTNVAGAVTYNVYRGVTAGGESSTPIATGLTSAPYIDNTAVNGTTYFYIIKGVNAAGIGPASNEVSVTPVNTVSAVAFWRFEEGMAGAVVVPGVQLPDSAGHNNTLQTPDADHAPTYSSNVPGNPTNPFLSNALSMDFSANPGGTAAARELNTGGATGDINTHTFNQMTVEMSFYDTNIGNYQTIVGREGSNYPNDATTGNADFYFQIVPVNGLNYLSIRGHETSDGQFIICNGTTNILGAQWYNAAGVADGHSLSLYLQTTPNGPYNLENSVPFNGAVGNQGTNWTVGRGFYGGNPTDRYFGMADEVRISDNALAPSQFLFAPTTGATVTGTICAGRRDRPERGQLALSAWNLLRDVPNGGNHDGHQDRQCHPDHHRRQCQRQVQRQRRSGGNLRRAD